MYMNGFPKKFLPILRCPYGHDTLDMSIIRGTKDAVIEGSLVCGTCQRVYPIQEGIPRMLPDELREV